MPESAAHWRKTRRLTMSLLGVWLVLTFCLGWFAGELNAVVVAGFPLGFYMSAQGALLIYLLIIWFYNRQMKRLDAEYGIKD